jgi:hypothetical protein
MEWIVVVWILWSVTNAFVASKKTPGKAGVIFLVSLIGSPALVYLYLLAIPAEPHSGGKGGPGSKVCPKCGLSNPESADKCDCGYRF